MSRGGNMAKKKYTRQTIIETAYKLSEEVGLDGITMKRIAKELNCSVMPIYESFSTKDELKEAVNLFSTNNSINHPDIHTIEDRYRKMIRFGLRYPEIFLSFVDEIKSFENEQNILKDLCLLMKKDERLKNFDDRQLIIINSRIEMLILGHIYAYKKYGYTKQREENILTIVLCTADILMRHLYESK